MQRQNIAIFVINLDRCEQRLRHCQHTLDQYGLTFERVSACDGQTLSTYRQSLCALINNTLWHRNLTAGEIACYLSHRKVWKLIRQRQLRYALVLEDDATVLQDPTPILTSLPRFPESWDIIKLTPARHGLLALSGDWGENLALCQKVSPGTSAQLISFAGANKLLTAPHKLCRPVDIELKYWWEKQLLILNTITPYFNTLTQFPSEIDLLLSRKKEPRCLWRKLWIQWQYNRSNKRYTRQLLQQFSNAGHRQPPVAK